MAAAAGISARLAMVLMAPFKKYNKLLEDRPLITKSVTSGVMYALGDIFAQGAQHYTEKKKHEEEQMAAAGGAGSLVVDAHPPKKFKVDWTRAAIFCVFGTVISGPAYTYWFGWLDVMPATLYQLRQSKQRNDILRAFNLLKRHGVEVNLVPSKLPNAKPISFWAEKAFKIGADQFIFSSLYTLVFFTSIGMMKGGVDKLAADKRMADLQAWEDELHAKFGGHAGAAAAALALAAPGTSGGGAAALAAGGGGGSGGGYLSSTLQSLSSSLGSAQGSYLIGGAAGRTVGASAAAAAAAGSPVASEAAAADPDPGAQRIDNVLALLKVEQAKKQRSWAAVWGETWALTKAKYLETYIVDCIVWPPLQLVNFTYVPLKLQVLYVNLCNLAWNTFLSLQANGGSEI